MQKAVLMYSSNIYTLHILSLLVKLMNYLNQIINYQISKITKLESAAYTSVVLNLYQCIRMIVSYKFM